MRAPDGFAHLPGLGMAAGGQASFCFPSAAIGVADDTTYRMVAHSVRPQQRLIEGSEVMPAGSHGSA